MAAALPYDPDQEPQGERRTLLERTPHGVSVLDVGCWSGFAGRFLIRERDVVIDGVEPDTDMAARARESYRTVYAERVEDAARMLAEEGTGYDVVLCLDVLEHLVDPAGALAALRGLAPRGRALISLPNVAHWSLRKELLRGRWEYTESGLLDRTHLRFYTLDTARSLLSQAGWRVEWESSSPGQPPLVRLPAQRLGVLQRWPRLFGVQLLFDAVPA